MPSRGADPGTPLEARRSRHAAPSTRSTAHRSPHARVRRRVIAHAGPAQPAAALPILIDGSGTSVARRTGHTATSTPSPPTISDDAAGADPGCPSPNHLSARCRPPPQGLSARRMRQRHPDPRRVRRVRRPRRIRRVRHLRHLRRPPRLRTNPRSMETQAGRHVLPAAPTGSSVEGSVPISWALPAVPCSSPSRCWPSPRPR